MASSSPSSTSIPESTTTNPGSQTTQSGTISTPNPLANPAARIVVNDPARTGYDPSLKWWMNYFKILTGQVTREGIEHYREDRYRVHEERDCKRCDEYRDWLLQYSPTVRFLNEKISALGGTLDDKNIVCRRCPGRIVAIPDPKAEGGERLEIARQSGGFSPDHGILLCANEIRDKSHLEDTLAHEMVHAWDHLRWKVDWIGEKSLRHAACTEIRASMLSGECRWTREAFTRNNWSLTQQFQNCVRMRAIQSVMARPTCKDDVHATKVVNEVWDSCFSDKRPFEEIYR